MSVLRNRKDGSSCCGIHEGHTKAKNLAELLALRCCCGEGTGTGSHRCTGAGPSALHQPSSTKQQTRAAEILIKWEYPYVLYICVCMYSIYVYTGVPFSPMAMHSAFERVGCSKELTEYNHSNKSVHEILHSRYSMINCEWNY